MAVLTDNDLTISFPIVKYDKTDDGDLMVYGRVTDGSVDSDEQIVDPEWSAKALKNWLETGANLRVQHNPHRDPAGVGLEVELNRDGDQAHWLKSLVIEPVAKKLVEKGALRAFSVGIMRPKIVSSAKARGGLIAGGDIGEVSLVDRPANKNCEFNLVKADKSGEPEWVGKMAGDPDTITKALTPSPGDVARLVNGKNPGGELPRPELGTIPSRMFADPVASRLNEALAAEDAMLAKRDFDPAVGGGTDRDKIPAGDFAGRGRSYPIVTQADVPDALQSIGRAGAGNYDAATLRRNITQIARRKGFSVPGDSDSKEKMDAAEQTLTQEGGQPEAAGESAAGDKAADADELKGKKKKTDPTLSAMDDDGSGDVDAEEDQAADPDTPTVKAAETDLDKKPSKRGGSDPATNLKNPANGADRGDSVSRPVKKKNPAFKCSGCGSAAGDEAKYCAGCGAEFTGKGRARGSGKPSDGARAKDTKPVPGHREPDGPDVEALEADAGLDDGDSESGGAPTWDDSKPRKGSAILAGSGTQPVGGSSKSEATAPYPLVRAHDAFCPAYSLKSVMEEYPSLSSIADAVSVPEMQEAAVKAVSDGDYVLGEELLRAARYAGTIASADKGVLSDARAEMHKSFAEMYPTASPQPGSISPRDIQRGYISDGHPPLSAAPRGTDAPGKLPPPSRNAQDFTRGPLGTGHARPSPGTTKDEARTAPGRGFFTHDARYSAEHAMHIVHDHIAGIFPDLCPVPAAGTQPPSPANKDEDGEPENRPTATLVKSRKDGKGARKADAAKNAQPDLAKAIATQVQDAIGPTLREQADKISQLQSLIDQLGSQPDPLRAPNRGIVVNNQAPGSGGAMPAERRSLADEAAGTLRDEKFKFLKSLAASGDPVLREQAEDQITKMLKA